MAGTRRERIIETLTRSFAPRRLDVVDESERHAGHAGHRPEGETHYRVHIVSKAFEGKSRIERHRMVNEALAGEFRDGVHALAIDAKTPDQVPD
jgi:BolA protein